MNITPGEWKASHPLDNIAYFGNQEGTIALIQWFAGIPVKEQKANAQLIASAPDVYEALKTIIDILEVPRQTPTIEDIEAAQKALAKAEAL